jgi:hypothetical protein
MPTLSNAALALLRACYSGAYILVDDDNRVAYRELADVGLMTPLHTPLGRESAYRMTEAGVSASASLFPSQPEAPSPHRSQEMRQGGPRLQAGEELTPPIF